MHNEKKWLRRGGGLILAWGCLLGMASAESLSILQWNLWRSGRLVPNGFQTAVDEIAHLSPDFALLSEIESAKGQSFADRITSALAKHGLKYYSFPSYDSGLISKYPIVESSQIFPDATHRYARSTIFRALVKVDGHEVAVYTAHLDGLHYACYLPKGYSGNNWKPLDKPVRNLEVILADNLKSWRDEAIACFLKVAAEDQKLGRIVILGGDFNEPSHLDWTQETAQMREHFGLVVPWHTSVALQKAGFQDAFRVMYPDPVQYPGFTFPTDCKKAPIDTTEAREKLAWAPGADERERIDYIYFYPGKSNLKLKKAQAFGPAGMILKAQRVTGDQGKDEILPPQKPDDWPSDHRGVYAEWTWDNP